MLFHVSIEADDPRRVAHALAELWQGVALPFPPVGIGSWAAMADDQFGSMIEVYQRGTEIREGVGDEGGYGFPTEPRRYTATHIAMATRLSAEEVYAIAEHYGWNAKYCRREENFGLIEVWIEGCFMLEVLTPEMQREYLATVTVENLAKAFADAPASVAA